MHRATITAPKQNSLEGIPKATGTGGLLRRGRDHLSVRVDHRSVGVALPHLHGGRWYVDKAVGGAILVDQVVIGTLEERKHHGFHSKRLLLINDSLSSSRIDIYACM